jgi:hypothetical protein
LLPRLGAVEQYEEETRKVPKIRAEIAPPPFRRQDA